MNVPVSMDPNPSNAVQGGDEPARTAERWLVRLRDPACSDRERAEFEHWRAADPRHARAYETAQALWAGLAGLAEDPELQAWRRQAQGASQEALRRRRRRGFLFAGAATGVAVVVAVLAPLWLHGLPAWPRAVPTEHHATLRGEQRSLTLADGSRLQLNTDTAVQVRMGRRARELVLERGEAVFDVARDTQRPFRVQAGPAAVTALGTRFNLRVDGDHATVTLLQGSVLAEGGIPLQSRRLLPGQRLTMAAAGAAWRSETVDPDTAASWTEGRLVFSSAPLGQVVAEMNRYGPGTLVLGDPGLADLSISGVFRTGEPERLVRALESAFAVRAEARGNGETVLLPVR